MCHVIQPDIFVITESWLKDFIDDNQVIDDTYQVHRQDRTGKGGGGILILVKSQYFSEERPELLSTSEYANEIFTVEVKNNDGQKLLIIGAYRPDSVSLYNFIPNLDHTLCTAYQAGFTDIIITGDFNTRNITWEDDSNLHLAPQDMQFTTLLEQYGLTQMVHEPTTLTGYIDDLFITSHPDKVNKIFIRGYDYDSDHFLIEALYNWKKNKLIQIKRKVYDMTKANFVELKTQLTNMDHSELTRQDLTIDQKWKSWYDKLMHAINITIPQKTIGKRTTPPWIDLECLKLIRKKNRTLSKAKKSQNPETERNFRSLRNRIKNVIKQKARFYINNLCENLATDPKKFWSLLKTKTKKNSLPQILRDAAGNDANTDIEKAELFKVYFHSTFNFQDNLPYPPLDIFTDPGLALVQVTPQEVSNELKSLNVNKAIGPDGIPTAVLKECHTEISHSLSTIFNLSLLTGTVPKAWKEANIVPIYKKGNPNLVTNYRPVSLLPVISKILEKLIHTKILPHILPKITQSQHGFMPSRSTVTQLLSTFTQVNQALDSGTRTDIIYFDLAKAFDSVPHKLLTYKLQSFGFNGPLLNWFSHYLLDRQQRVVINGSKSTWSPVISGVPQGATLGPLKFILYVNDLPNTLSPNTQCGIFADDTKILRQITTTQDTKLLQTDIDKLFDWSTNWGLKFNPKKCMVLSINRQHTRNNIDLFDYTMNGTKLKSEENVKDLGVIIDKNFSWATHIYTMVRKAHSRSWLCMRAIGFHAPRKAKLASYLTMVRSILEYGSTIWSPSYKHLIICIESIQRRATNYILNNPKRPNPMHINYKERLLLLKLLPLSFRREILDIQLFLKIWNSANKFGLDQYIHFTEPTITRITRSTTTAITLSYRRSRLSTTPHFYPYRLSLLWNKLPMVLRLKLRYMNENYKIKKILVPYYMSKLSDTYDPLVTCTWVTHCTCPRCRPW